MRKITILLAVLAVVVMVTETPAAESLIRVPVNLNSVNNSSQAQNISAYSNYRDGLGSWLFSKFGHHSFRSRMMSARQGDTYYKGLFNSANGIIFETFIINAILDYDDYTHIDHFLEQKE